MHPAKHIAIFLSGSGTNAANILQYFKDNEDVKVDLVLSNNPHAGGLEIGRQFQVPTITVTKEQFNDPIYLLTVLKEHGVQLIVLAGFLWLVPEFLVHAYDNRIINIHPALLPKYGGKGMYGKKVHEAVIAVGEKESGMTIHYVNTLYDEGNIIFQAKCNVDKEDTPETLSKKVQQLEHEWYPKVIEKLLHP